MSHPKRRLLFAGLLAGLLYGAPPASATENAPTAERPYPHIALLLPLGSGAFARVADVVRQGFLAAVRAQPDLDLPVVAYPTSDESAELFANIERARAHGARFIVGPLSRPAVTALAASDRVTVPTLALNVPEGDRALPERLHAYGLLVEVEARQVARMAFEQGRRSLLTVSDGSVIARRLQKAFVDEFVRLGGRSHADFAYSTSNANLGALREATAKGDVDAVLLALDGERARLVRPYVDGLVSVYATSQVYDAKAASGGDLDLNGVRFVDMPWLLQPDHPAVMIYPRREGEAGAGDFERLYAFGIDAFRIAFALLRSTDGTRTAIDGVTGRISLGRDRVFQRELTPAQFSEGRPVVLPERP